MLVEERVHVHAVVPADLREDIVVQVVEEPAVRLGLGERAVHVRRHLLVEVRPGARTVLRHVLRLHVEAEELAGIVPHADRMPQLLRPRLRDCDGVGAVLRALLVPLSVDRGHHLDVRRQGEVGNVLVSVVGHHRYRPLQTIGREARGEVRDDAPDEVRLLGLPLRAAGVDDLPAPLASAGDHAVLRHYVDVLPVGAVAVPAEAPVLRPRGRNAADGRVLALKVADGVLVHLLDDAAGPAELAGLDAVEHLLLEYVALAVGEEAEVFGMRLPEASLEHERS